MPNDHAFEGLRVQNFPQDPGGPTPKQLRIGCGIALAVLLLVLLTAAVAPYTDYLWYAHDARHPEVFTTAYNTRATMFLVGFLVALVVMLFNLSRAFKVSPVYSKVPETPAEVFLSNAVGYVQHNTGKVVKFLSLGFALIYALGLQKEWNTFLMAMNRQEFGQKDPTFGLDLGFFVFTLPWLQAVANFAFGLLFVTTVLTTGAYLGLRALASLARIELGRPAERTHVAVLAGLTLLAYAAQLWLHRFEFGLLENAQFTGAGLAGMWRLGGLTAFCIALVGVAVAAAVFGRNVKTMRIPWFVGGSCVVVYLLVMGVVPAIVQAFKVTPNVVQAEGPYAEHAIRMTRYAYGLDKIQVRESPVLEEPTPEEVAGASKTLDNMRLWDPEVLRQYIEAMQGLKPYYTFSDVDIDRYVLDGKQTLVMLSPRDIRLEGLQPNTRGWLYTRLQYTHGYGLTMSPVNTATANGQPNFVIQDMPVRTPESLPLNEPRLYFSDFRDSQGQSTDEYALVDTKVDEFDYPGQGEEKKHRWKGERGVPVGTLLSRLAHTVLFGDRNLLVSPNITPSTRVLYRRGVIERAALIYPFLRFDNDPYIVVSKGRILWILDGYTATGQIPYSARIAGDSEHLNYIRNSVKVVLDAYTGIATAYAIEPDEPVLKAYRKIYPDLVKDAAQLPEGLDAHFRYPEDLFALQSMQLTQYHVVDRERFLNNEDAWDMASERGIHGERAKMRPYYVQLQLPGDPEGGFLLILPFTPREKGNLSGWLAARCDPGEYGQLVLYKFPKGSNIAGPTQMEARFNQDPIIADINRQFTNDQSKIVVGNLLVIPIGRSVMYVEPMFLQSRTAGIQPIPEMKKVILGLKSKVVVADTYAGSLDKLFAGGAPKVAAPTPVPGAPEPGPAQAAPPAADIGELLKLLDAQDAALRDGDFARFGELRKELKRRLEAMSRQGS